MAWDQADLDNLRECIASGVLSTRFADGRQVTYQSMDALMAAERRVASALAAQAPRKTTRRRTPIYFRSGC